MARRGDVIESPLLGERIVFLRTSQETGGEVLELDDFASPGSGGPPVHLHTRQEERLLVMKGTVYAEVGGVGRTYHVGETIIIPPGTAHTWRNAGSEELQLRSEFRPALRSEQFFETLFGLHREGRAHPDGTPYFLQIMAWTGAYEMFLPSPPPALQKILSSVLGPIARLLGYRAWYPSFSPDAPNNG